MFFIPTLRAIFNGTIIYLTYDSFESASFIELNKQFGGRGGWTSSLSQSAYSDRYNYVGLQTEDTFEAYISMSYLTGLNSGSGWSGSYYENINYLGLQTYDDMETYVSSSNLLLLSGGTGWRTTYSSSDNFTGLQSFEDFEVYNSGSTLTGLNSGSGWISPFNDI